MTERLQILTEQLAVRKAEIEQRVRDACHAEGRDPADVTIVAVTKQVDDETARAAVQAGFLDLGENRPQALLQKQQALADLPGRWHLIGHLQRNKVRSILPLTHLIHAVDSVRLAETMSRIAGEETLEIDALLQVNLSGETSKHGFAKSEAKAAAAALGKIEHVRWRGLMTMAPIDADESYCRSLFSRTRDLRNALQSVGGMAELCWLSMGMSRDFEAAVAAGATHIRLGSVLFGNLRS